MNVPDLQWPVGYVMKATMFTQYRNNRGDGQIIRY